MTETTPHRPDDNAQASLRPPLTGIRIVDLTQFQSGPMVTMMAGDLGAEIIKVESVQRVDGWRGMGRGDQRWENAPNFNWANRNKKGITLNLTDPRGADLLRRLVAISDVVVENYTPRVMANFGLSYDHLRTINENLIMLSMPGFGRDGSWRDYTAFAWTTEQMSTLCHLTGYEDSGPLFTSTTGGDQLAALMGTLALLSAIIWRRKTGVGQHIDLSQTETATSFVADNIIAAQISGEEPTRHGNSDLYSAPHGIYPCREDGWIAIACEDDHEWQALRETMASDGVTVADAYDTLDERLAARQDLDKAVATWTATKPASDLMHELQARGIPAGIVATGEDILHDRHLASRGFMIAQERARVGTKHYFGLPFRYSDSPLVTPQRAPYLGEYNEEVLSGLLGVSSEELADLESDDVIGSTPLDA